MDIRKLMERAIEIAGSEQRLGEACGCSQHKIWKAKVSEKVEPVLAMRIEQFSNGEIQAHELAPHLPWPCRKGHQPSIAGAAS